MTRKQEDSIVEELKEWISILSNHEPFKGETAEMLKQELISQMKNRIRRLTKWRIINL